MELGSFGSADTARDDIWARAGSVSNPHAVAATNIIRLVVAVITKAAFGWSGKYDDVSVRCFI